VELPRKLVEQLRVSGRMCIPIGEYDQMLYLVIKTEKGVQSIPKIPVAFVPLIREASGEYPPE
jgi:protein-L-isoaspartate(D-aspartate) O-methyltransferase